MSVYPQQKLQEKRLCVRQQTHAVKIIGSMHISDYAVLMRLA